MQPAGASPAAKNWAGFTRFVLGILCPGNLLSAEYASTFSQQYQQIWRVE
jgi:hypothetical protein